MTNEIVTTVLSNGAIGVLLLYIFNKTIKQVDDNTQGLIDLKDKVNSDLITTDEKVEGIVGNYLARFEEIKDIMNVNNKEVMKELGNIKTDVAVVQTNCLLIQKAKER